MNQRQRARLHDRVICDRCKKSTHVDEMIRLPRVGFRCASCVEDLRKRKKQEDEEEAS